MNLDEPSADIHRIDKNVYETYLGGKGLTTWLLLDQIPQGTDPLSPENRLVFATGAVQGMGSLPNKSPLTGLYAESYSGGKVPEAVSATGFDAIVIHGRTPEQSWEPRTSRQWFLPGTGSGMFLIQGH